MKQFVLAGLMALAVGGFSQVAEAQATLTVPNGLAAGDEVTITYSDPARAGQAVTIEISDGEFPTPHKVPMVIQLDETGKGSSRWVVPGWDTVTFNGPGFEEVTRFITGSPADQDYLAVNRSVSFWSDRALSAAASPVRPRA